MIHLNGDLLCAIDIETTGLDPRQHEIYQIAILPLDGGLNVHPSKRLLDMTLRPDKVENIDWEGMKKNNNQDDVIKACKDGIDKFQAADYLSEWFEKLQLPERKRIVPLAHNWAGIDKEFISEWLGPVNYNSIFHFHYRDLMTSCLYLNDRADAFNERIPFPKVGLQYICSQLQIERNGRAHTALEDCVITAKCYKKILTHYTFI